MALTLKAAVSRSQSLPRSVSQIHYRMAGRARPLLFWVSRDDVGAARVTLQRDDGGTRHYQLLIGSNPARAPRHLNSWGYVSEVISDGRATVVGIVKGWDEKALDDYRSEAGEGGPRRHVYKMIRATVAGGESNAAITTVISSDDFGYGDLEKARAMLEGAPAGTRATRLVVEPDARPGFLIALAELVDRIVDEHRGAGGPRPARVRSSLRYVFGDTLYLLTLKSAELRHHARIGGRVFPRLVRCEFETRNYRSGSTTEFELTSGLDEPYAGIPVSARYRPSWWLEVAIALGPDVK